MQTPKFLSYQLVLRIHTRQIYIFGGSVGVRDEGLLLSALAQPSATFGGEYLHGTIYEQAAAYLYHISKNHPFIDGNKRTAFAVMDTFLLINGYILNLTNDEAYRLVIEVAQGIMEKSEIVTYIEQHLLRQ